MANKKKLKKALSRIKSADAQAENAKYWAVVCMMSEKRVG